ncbi:DNA binding [Phytophthora ramorum]|nr:hypothetical protein KRP22_7967 [Phytophthora ramorum]
MGKGRHKHTENGGRRPRAYKRSVPTHQFRLDVGRYFETHTMEATMSEFYQGLTGSQRQTKRTNVYLWRKNKDKLEELCKTTATSQLRKVRLRGMATTLPRNAEVHMVQWINTYRVLGLPVSSVMLHRKALSIAIFQGTSSRRHVAGRLDSCEGITWLSAQRIGKDRLNRTMPMPPSMPSTPRSSRRWSS